MKQQRKREFIGVERNQQIDRAVEKERRRLQAVRGKDAFVGRAEAVRSLILRGSTVKVK